MEAIIYFRAVPLMNAMSSLAVVKSSASLANFSMQRWGLQSSVYNIRNLRFFVAVCGVAFNTCRNILNQAEGWVINIPNKNNSVELLHIKQLGIF